MKTKDPRLTKLLLKGCYLYIEEAKECDRVPDISTLVEDVALVYLTIPERLRLIWRILRGMW